MVYSLVNSNKFAKYTLRLKETFSRIKGRVILTVDYQLMYDDNRNK